LLLGDALHALDLSEANHLLFIDCLKTFHDAKYQLTNSLVPSERNLSYKFDVVQSKYNDALKLYEEN